jgi:hypothetical protein
LSCRQGQAHRQEDWKGQFVVPLFDASHGTAARIGRDRGLRPSRAYPSDYSSAALASRPRASATSLNLEGPPRQTEHAPISKRYSARDIGGIGAHYVVHGQPFEHARRYLQAEPISTAAFYTGRLSLSEIRSEHTDDAVRRELASAECVRQFERFSGSARPYSGIGECAPL